MHGQVFLHHCCSCRWLIYICRLIGNFLCPPNIHLYRDVKDVAVLIVMMIISPEFGFVLLSCCYKCCHWWWCTAIITINLTLTPSLILCILPRTTSCRSFVPPVRDEESETQRKAHAKRVRETRRSTQGVTLDEIKSAEELVKKKNLNSNGEVSERRQVHDRGMCPTWRSLVEGVLINE